MYATMLVSCVGLVGCTLRLLTPRGAGLPLRWGGYPPLTEIPLDLLFIHLGLPLLVGRFHPLARLKRALIAWLSATVEALRLASYFFDAPEPVAWVNGSDDGSDIEVTLRPPPAAAPDMRDRTDTPAKQAVDRLVGWLAPFGRRDFMEGVGGWARVPAVDHLRILPARRMFVRLDDDHAPLNAEELRLLVAINKKAVDAGRDPAADFGVVWLPGHVRSRIYLLLGALWASCLAVAALAVGIVGLGRLMLRLLILGGEKAHDGYALLAGSTVLAGCVEVGLTTEIALRRWSLAQQVAKRRPRPFIRRTTLARRARFFATGAFASVVLVIVVPLVVGLVVETALLLPFRSSAIDPAVIHLAEVWALGALVLSCLVRIRPVLPPVAVLRELDLAYGHHRFRWSAKRLVRRLLGPLLGLAAAAISAPWAAAALCSLGSNDVARNARLSASAL
jgi:E3 ubiquitin-protein ligase MARCH6